MPTNPAVEKEVQIVIPGVNLTLVKRVEKLAKREGRSRASQIRMLLEEAVLKREREMHLTSQAA